jgi:uncharacterized protein YqjF (DUF2071 family)
MAFATGSTKEADMQTKEIRCRQVDWSEAGKRRLLGVKGDPFLFARWENVVFFNFAVEPETLRSQVPPPFELELHEGRGVASAVVVIMRQFRPVRRASPAAWPFALVSRQTFLNLRAYVRLGDESGVFFLWGWLSRPLGLPLPSGMFGLPYAFAESRHACAHENGELSGLVTSRRMIGRFAYRARFDHGAAPAPCEPGTSSEFAMERYTGFFCRGKERCVFRAWHPPWLQVPLAAVIEDRSLLDAAFPWFRGARLLGANYAPGFERVRLGKAHRVASPQRRKHQALTTFFEMP